MKNRLHSFPFSLKLTLAATGAMMALLSPLAHAAPATWNATPTDGNWEASGAENNWSTGLGTYPGSLTGYTNTDTATFDTSSTTAINIASPLNIENITFGSATASSASAYTLSGAALDLTNGGAITMSTGAGASETINDNLVIEPASSSTAGSLTLTNNATGTSNILTIGGNIAPDSTNTTSAGETLYLGGTNTGANDITGTITQTGATGGVAISKSGAGTWELGGNGTSTASSIGITGGTLQFGSGTETPTLNLTGSGLGINGGTVNVDAGTLGLGASNGAFTMNTGSYNQTGGAVSTTGIGYLGNNGSTNSAFAISGGTFTAGSAYFYNAVRGTGTITVSGTGVLDLPNYFMLYGSAGVSNSAAAVMNLGTGTAGGTLEVNAVNENAQGASTGTATFNFNGGTLKALASSTTFMQGLTTANVDAGGAIINTNGFNDTIAQNLLSNATTDGGLTKQGNGNLILSGTNTYNGGTVINGGLLGITSDASLGAAPSSVTANNIQFTGTGTLQDTTNNVTLNSNRGITITDGVNATLDSSTNTFVVSGPITDTTGSTANTITLAGSGAGAGTLSGTISDNSTGGYTINQTSSGTWTLGMSGTLAKAEITQNAGTLNFGSSTLTPSLTINGGVGSSNIGVYVNAGTFNMNSGSLTVNDGQGLVLNGAGNIYDQTGGTFTTTGFIEFANGSSSATSTVNVSGGTLKTTDTGNNPNDSLDLAVRGTTTATVSGTGIISAPILNMTTNQTSATGTTSTFNLGVGAGDGGTLIVGGIIPGTNTSTGSRTFNFNGGTLESSASSTTFMAGGSTSTFNVDAGGAIINTEGFNDTIGQGLVHGSGGTADGGLTKNGTGTLTLSGANTYNGNTTITAGTVALASGSSLASGIIVDDSTVATTGGFNVASLTSGFTLASGQELAGNGNVTGQINTGNGSKINPGTLSTPGTLTLNTGLDVTSAGTQISFRLDTTTTSDEVLLTGGTFTQSSGTVINLADGGAFAGVGTYSLIDASALGTNDMTLADYSLGTTIAGYNETLTVNGADDVLQVQVTAAPEPKAWMLMLGGLALLFHGVRRRNIARNL